MKKVKEYLPKIKAIPTTQEANRNFIFFFLLFETVDEN